VDYCVDQQFGKTTTKNEEMKDEVLRLVGEIEPEQDLTDYVPNFVVVDENPSELKDETPSYTYPIKEPKKPDVEQLEMDLGFEKQNKF
jgi:hypothetical protein